MANLDQKIIAFIENYFPDIDYSVLGKNEHSDVHRTALNYEYFVNSIEYYRFQKEINSESIKQISAGDLRGIDGCFIILNNQFFFIPDFEDNDIFGDWKDNLDEAIERAPKIDAQFIFIQSKSSKTELDKFRGFCSAVYDIFSKEETDISDKPKVKTIKYVFEKICKKEHSMHLFLKHCAIQKDSRTISKLLEKPEWKTTIAKEQKELKSTIFSDVDIKLLSGQDYQEKLEAILSPNQRVFPIDLKERFVKITDEKATCYIGYLNLFEIKKLLKDENGDLDDVFFDNIRYFEGYGSTDWLRYAFVSPLNNDKIDFCAMSK